jgi:hypothetical protein
MSLLSTRPSAVKMLAAPSVPASSPVRLFHLQPTAHADAKLVPFQFLATLFLLSAWFSLENLSQSALLPSTLALLRQARQIALVGLLVTTALVQVSPFTFAAMPYALTDCTRILDSRRCFPLGKRTFCISS